MEGARELRKIVEVQELVETLARLERSEVIYFIGIHSILKRFLYDLPEERAIPCMLHFFNLEGPSGGPQHGGDGQNNPSPGAYGEQSQAAKDEAEFVMQYMTLSETIRKMIGHDFESFLKMCTFRGSDCLDSM